jgi:adenine C2-methylase RlmN of 23S rRNA A2503 and tRNA A37
MQILFDPHTLQSYLDKHQLPAFRAKQIRQAIFKESILDIDQITTLSKELRAQLKEQFVINHLKLIDLVE